MNTTKKKQTHRYREQTSGDQWGGGTYKLLGVRQAQRCIVQPGENSQYFIITVNGK